MNETNNPNSGILGNEKASAEMSPSKIPKGLLAAGLTALVGSWIGMAVYMNYRLASVEDQLIKESRNITSSVNQNNQELHSQLQGAQNAVIAKVGETSSVLAKGLLELTNKEETRHGETIAALQNNQNVIANNRKELETSILNNQSKQTEVISNLVNALDSRSQESGQAILASLQQVGSAQQNVMQKIDESSKALQDLVQLSQQSNTQQLNELASHVNAMSEKEDPATKQIQAELTALAGRIDEFQTQLYASQESLQRINQTLPQWSATSQESLQNLNQNAQQLSQSLEDNLTRLQQRLTEISGSIEQSSETLMRTLYATTEGFEGSQIELKSDVSSIKEDTKADLQKLNDSILSISTQLEQWQAEKGNKTTSFSAKPPGEYDEVLKRIQQFTSNSVTWRAQLKSQLEEAGVRLDKMTENSQFPQDATTLKNTLNEFGRYMNETNTEMDSILQGLQTIGKWISTFSGTAGPGGESPPAVTEAGTDVPNQSPEGDNPEKRTKEEAGVSLY